MRGAKELLQLQHLEPLRFRLKHYPALCCPEQCRVREDWVMQKTWILVHLWFEKFGSGRVCAWNLCGGEGRVTEHCWCFLPRPAVCEPVFGKLETPKPGPRNCRWAISMCYFQPNTRCSCTLLALAWPRKSVLWAWLRAEKASLAEWGMVKG